MPWVQMGRIVKLTEEAQWALDELVSLGTEYANIGEDDPVSITPDYVISQALRYYHEDVKAIGFGRADQSFGEDL